MKGYPRWFLRALIAALLLIWATGALLAPTTLVLRSELEMARLPGAARVLTAALHAAGGFILTMLIGALFSVHMRSGWRRRRQRVSGLLVASLFMVLNASAVGIYYLGDDTLGAAAAFIHLGVGFVLIWPLAWHWVHGRRKGPQQPASNHKSKPRRPGSVGGWVRWRLTQSECLRLPLWGAFRGSGATHRQQPDSIDAWQPHHDGGADARNGVHP